MIPSVSATDLDAEIKGAADINLLDVRETFELEISKLNNITHIPMGELPQRLAELDRNASWVVICRTGGRSGRVTETLLANGFSSVRNLDGGMNGWARDVDSNLAIY
ncbi:MAG: rhodanese-like domain-containing protein [Fimbriimonadaceae bacterium]